MQPQLALKDSGVDWISGVPPDWGIVRAARIFSFTKGADSQRLTNTYIAQHTGPYPVFSGQTANNGILGMYDQYEFDEPAGAILVTTVGAKAMSVRYLQKRFSLSQNCLIMRPKKTRINTKYYYYAVHPLFAKERNLIPDHMQPSLRMGDLAAYKLPLPDIQTQTQIVNYLDAEIAHIDELITKQKQLLALLEEKRQLTVASAVTRGLNPRGQYKATDIKWLPPIPGHWEVRRAKYLFRRVQDRPLSTDQVVTAFRDGEVVLRNARRTDGFTLADKEIGYQHVSKGDLVIHAMDGFAGAIGVSKSEGKMSPVCSICRPINSGEAMVDYFALLVRTMAKSDWLTAIAKGVRERSTDFRWADFADMEFPLPPLNEQRAIVQFISNEQEKTETLRAKIMQEIELLKERRISLIHNVVTGKVKV